MTDALTDSSGDMADSSGDALGVPDVSRDTADSVDLIRHEEQFRVGVERFPLERVRLEKFIVTEEQTITVAVRREEVRLVRESLRPDTPISPTPSGGGPVVMTVREERPVVTMQLVPVERVWLTTNIVTEQHTVTDTIRNEEIDLSTTQS